MAKNTRDNVKWVRDKCKSAYEKADKCAICDTTADLELHHTHSMRLLLDKWAALKGYDISTDAGILAVREEFIAEHRKEIYEDVFTLCNKHHVKLHGVYGKAPALSTASKQAEWIRIQRAKIFDPDSLPVSAFSKFTSVGGKWPGMTYSSLTARKKE